MITIEAETIATEEKTAAAEARHAAAGVDRWAVLTKKISVVHRPTYGVYQQSAMKQTVLLTVDAAVTEFLIAYSSLTSSACSDSEYQFAHNQGPHRQTTPSSSES